jgi:hypothetical protein
MFVGIPRVSCHQIRRSSFEGHLLSGGSRAGFRQSVLVCPHIRAELHSTRREQRNACDDAVLRCVAVPADRCARRVLVDECHHKRTAVRASPHRDPVPQWQKKGRQRSRRWATCVVRPAKERDPPAGHHAAHLERGELHARDFLDQRGFFINGDEVVSIVKAIRHAQKQMSHSGMDALQKPGRAGEGRPKVDEG